MTAADNEEEIYLSIASLSGAEREELRPLGGAVQGENLQDSRSLDEVNNIGYFGPVRRESSCLELKMKLTLHQEAIFCFDQDQGSHNGQRATASPDDFNLYNDKNITENGIVKLKYCQSYCK